MTDGYNGSNYGDDEDEVRDWRDIVDITVQGFRMSNLHQVHFYYYDAYVQELERLQRIDKGEGKGEEGEEEEEDDWFDEDDPGFFSNLHHSCHQEFREAILNGRLSRFFKKRELLGSGIARGKFYQHLQVHSFLMELEPTSIRDTPIKFWSSSPFDNLRTLKIPIKYSNGAQVIESIFRTNIVSSLTELILIFTQENGLPARGDVFGLNSHDWLLMRYARGSE